jgi:hypothetical protein
LTPRKSGGGGGSVDLTTQVAEAASAKSSASIPAQQNERALLAFEDKSPLGCGLSNQGAVRACADLLFRKENNKPTKRRAF